MSTTVLVIDDSQVITKLIEHHFTLEGFQVLVANEGEAGLKLADAHQPDAILLDVQMPGIDGFEVCKRLRRSKTTKQIPVIMLTSLSSIANKEAGFQAGADDYITKPFDNAELLLRIKSILRRADRAQTGEVESQVVSIFSLRGGAGCSSLAVNLAAGFSTMWRTNAVLVDLALPTGLCDVMLNLKTRHGLSTLLNTDTASIDHELVAGCLTPHESGLQLLGGIVRPQEAELISDNLISFALEHLRNLAEYIVIDTSHNFSAPILAALDQSDQILMPITPDINSVRLAATALDVFDALGYPREKIDILVNWTFEQAGIKSSRIESIIKHPIKMVIPHVSEVWSKAINLGNPVILNEEESPLTAMLEDLVWRMSLPEHRDTSPDQPSPMWQRTSRRLTKVDAVE